MTASGRDIAARVYFTYDLDETNDPVTAVFADSFGEEAAGMYTVYAHIGQHSTGSPAWVASRTRAATPAEYADLLAELGRIGYRVTPVTGLDR